MNESKTKKLSVFRVVVLSLAGVAALAVTACNTVEGAGKDLQETSRNVKDAINN